MTAKPLLLLFLTSLCASKVVSYVAPQANFEALSPRGLRVSMRDDGFTSFTFFGNLQNNKGTKQWQTIIPRAKNGVWTFMDRNYDLQIGDTIYYKIYFIKAGIRYEVNGHFIVNEFVPDENVPTCEVSATNTLCSKKICKNTPIFNEEFDNPLKFFWQKEDMFPMEPDYPFNVYAQEKVRINNGILEIGCSRTFSGADQIWDIGYACTGEAGTRECKQVPSGSQILPPVVCGKVTTRKLFSFKYGRIEVRAKLPAGDWLIPEISLEPLSHEYGRQDYGSGLIQIAYLRGNQADSNELFGGLVFTAKEPYRSAYLKSKIKASGNWNDEFHTYTLIWKPDGIQLLVDGEIYGSINPNSNITESDIREVPHSEMWGRGSPIAPFDEMFYISLGLRVGGINDFPDSPEKPWKNNGNKAMYKFAESKHHWYRTWTSPTLEVDYVHVFSL